MCCTWTRSPIGLTERLRALGREHWVFEDCLALEDRAALRARSRAGLEAAARPQPAAARRRARAPGRSRCGARRLARERDLPRGWITRRRGASSSSRRLNPATRAALEAVPSLPASR